MSLVYLFHPTTESVGVEENSHLHEFLGNMFPKGIFQDPVLASTYISGFLKL